MKLNEACIKITDGSHFSPKGTSVGFPMLSVKDMEDYGFNYDNCKHIDEKDMQIMIRQDCVPQKNDILIAKDGSFLKHIFICDEQKEQAILSSIAIIRPNTKIVDPYFLMYALKNPKVFNYVKRNYVSGSALPRIILKDFKKIELYIPDLPRQKWISNILKSLDKKIILNYKTNKKLIEIVKAYYLNKIGNLSIVDGYKELPRNWKEGKVSDIITLLDSQRIPLSSKEREDLIKYIPITEQLHVWIMLTDIYLMEDIFC